MTSAANHGIHISDCSLADDCGGGSGGGGEAGDGSLWVLMVNSTIDENLDEGVDMDEEEGDGDLQVNVRSTTTVGNDGVELR